METTYQCSACGYPVPVNSLNCPSCLSRFSGIAQATTPKTFGLPELAVAAVVGLGLGIIIGAKGARQK